MSKDFLEYRQTDNSSVYRKLHKMYHAGCVLCRWHRGENRSRQPTYGKQKPKTRLRRKDSRS